MALGAFDDTSRRPTAADLKRVLGTSATLWTALIAHVTETHAPITEEWSFSGAKYGWSLRLKHRDRIVLYLTPQAGRFLVGVVLGERAAKAAHEQGLPKPVLALIDAAPRYAEGRGIRVPVSTRKDLRTVEMLAALKMET